MMSEKEELNELNELKEHEEQEDLFGKIRLSKEDSNKKEYDDSESIKNQRLMLYIS